MTSFPDAAILPHNGAIYNFDTLGVPYSRRCNITRRNMTSLPDAAILQGVM